MIKLILESIILIALTTTAVSADNVKLNTTDSFNDYASGAMSVYTKFKKPNKDQSEKFFAFVKSKWQTTQCLENCNSAGVAAGKEYAYLMNVPLDE